MAALRLDRNRKLIIQALSKHSCYSVNPKNSRATSSTKASRLPNIIQYAVAHVITFAHCCKRLTWTSIYDPQPKQTSVTLEVRAESTWTAQCVQGMLL